MDFSWCGNNLLACSQDGTVKVITLDEQLLGEILTDADMVIVNISTLFLFLTTFQSDLCYQIYSIRPPQYESRNFDGENTNPNDFLALEAASSSQINASFVTCPEEVLMKRKVR